MYQSLKAHLDPKIIASEMIKKVNTELDVTLQEGHPVAVMLEACAVAVADANRRMSIISENIFDSFGEQIVGVVKKQSAYATTKIEVTAIDLPPQIIERGAVIDIDGWRFETIEEVALDLDDEDNLYPIELELLALIEGQPETWATVKTVGTPYAITATVTSPPSGGATGETAIEYRERLAETLGKLANTAITPEDLEVLCKSFDTVATAIAVNRYNPDTQDVDALGHITLYVATTSGTAVSEDIKTQILNTINNNRIVNITAHLADPHTETININISVQMVDGADETTLKDNIKNVIAKNIKTLNSKINKKDNKKLYPLDLLDNVDNVEGLEHILQIQINDSSDALDFSTLTSTPVISINPNITVQIDS